MRNMKVLRLEANQALAFSEKQWKRFIKQVKQLKEQGGINISIYSHGENEFYTAIPLLKTSLPFAEVKVITVEPERIFTIDDETKIIRQALKKSRGFKRIVNLNNVPVWELVWKYSFSVEDFEEIRKIEYPLFYVVLNNSKESIEIPL